MLTVKDFDPPEEIIAKHFKNIHFLIGHIKGTISGYRNKILSPARALLEIEWALDKYEELIHCIACKNHLRQPNSEYCYFCDKEMAEIAEEARQRNIKARIERGE